MLFANRFALTALAFAVFGGLCFGADDEYLDKSETKKSTFENAMETLEEIVNQLEAGDIPLNELIDKYNEGMKLSAFCLDELNRAKDAIYAEVDVKDNKIIEKKLDIEGDY